MRCLAVAIAIVAASGCSCGESHRARDAGQDAGATPITVGPGAVCRDAAGSLPRCMCDVDVSACPCDCAPSLDRCESDCDRCPDPVCERFMPQPLPRPWWIDDPPADCVDSPRHEPIQAYDDCGKGPGDTASTPADCCMPLAGVAYCTGRYWTQTCLTDDDCPEDMLCVDDTTYVGRYGGASYRICRKRCSNTGDPAECVRCDERCNDDGYCEYNLVEERGPPCRADCDCWGADPRHNPYNRCGADGFCVATSGDRSGTCDTNRGPLDDYCACSGGTCEPTPGGGCCIAPDGHVALSSGDPVCGTR